jgi:hypothetical protein
MTHRGLSPHAFVYAPLLGEATLLSLHNDAPMQKRQDSPGTVPARFRVRAPFGEATLLSLHNDAPMQKRQECRFPES